MNKIVLGFLEIIMKILITGATGQLGQTVLANQKHYRKGLTSLLLADETVTLVKKKTLKLPLTSIFLTWFLNLAAYTDVAKSRN